MILLLSLLGCAGPAASHDDAAPDAPHAPAHPAPDPHEPAHAADPTHADPVHPAPVNPAHADPSHVAPTHVAPTDVEPSHDQRALALPAHAAPAHVDPHPPEPGRADVVHTDAGQADVGDVEHADAGQAEPPHPEPTHTGPAHTGPAPVVTAPPPASDAPGVGQALRNALFRVVLGFGLVLGVGLLASTTTRRLPQLRTEIFRTRFVATVVLIGWTALAAITGVQGGGSVASLGSLATIVVLTTGYGLWWVPRYLDGLWVVLTANQRRLEIECNGIRGTLADVGPMRAILVDGEGVSSSVPISSFGGAIVRSGLEHRVRLELTIPGDVEQARLRAIISPFRDPTEPVLLDRKTGVLTVRCWEEGAASCLEAELLQLTT